MRAFGIGSSNLKAGNRKRKCRSYMIMVLMGESGETILARRKGPYLKLWEVNGKVDRGQTDEGV